MFTRINRALDASLARRQDGEKGFTLIELLVVVLIIGVLAAIAIPIFLGQQESARVSAVEAELSTAKTALVSEMVTDSTFTVAAGALPALDDFTPSADITITVTEPAAGGFCLQGTHDGSTANVGATLTPLAHVLDTGGVETGACPA